MRNFKVIACIVFLHFTCGITFFSHSQLDIGFNPTISFQDNPKHLNDLMPASKISDYSLSSLLDNSYKILSGTIFPKLEYNPYELSEFPLTPINENFNFLNQHYNNYKLYPLSDFTALLLNNQHQVFYGMGATDNLSGSFLFQPDDRWQISLTGAGYRTVDFTGLRTNFTVGGATRFALTDRIGLNAFGAYVVNQGNTLNHSFPVLSPLAPQHTYGGTVDFRITEHWGVEAGTQMKFNPFTGKWDRQYIIGPKYYK